MTLYPGQEIAVHRSVSVPLGPDRAFTVFTDRMHEFWPPGHSIGSSPRAAVVVEPRAGGRWYERGDDGSECPWGRVAVWEPPDRLVLIWQISADWAFDPDLETEVEVTFTETATTPGHTLLDLRHRHLERYGERGGAMRDVLGSSGGWPGILDAYAGAVS